MPETILKIMLEELKTVRLVCQADSCGAVIEFGIEKLASAPTKCPVCAAEFHDPTSDKQKGYLSELFTALHHLEFVRGRVKVQFVLPQRDTK